MITVVASRGRPVATGLGWILRGLRLGLSEVWWWVAGPFRFLIRSPGRAVAWTAATVYAYLHQVWLLLTALIVLALIPALWARCWPTSYLRHVVHPAWRRRIRRSVKRAWPGLMEASGLGRRVIGKDGTELRVPVISRSRWEDPDVLVVTPQLMVGQTVDDLVAASERLRTTVGSRQIRIIPNSAHTGCTVRFLFADPLATVVDARFPAPNLAASITTAEMGVTEDGQPWRLPIPVSTLTAGCSGSGKASAMWMLLLSLAPAIRSGLVQVHGVDLKGGMELGLGTRLFTRYATTPEEAVILLEDAVTAMSTRAATLAGHARSHTPTPGAPLVLVLIDELAMLTSYLSNQRDLFQRADKALRALLALGRAPGFVVWGFLQDPRKETLPQRHMFTQTIALRLREREEVAMVLSDGAVAAGAWCHKIPRTTPGVGYALTEDGEISRVRCAYVPDDMIRALAVHFPAPIQIPIRLPDLDPAPRPRTRTARSRS